ncbi:MAG: tetratricopeptide repeat protein [Bacteriovoracaceae bacterium]
MKIFLLLWLLLISPLLRSQVLEAEKFLSWLENHKKMIIECKPIKVEGGYQLCDNTFVDKKIVEELFKKSPDELVEFITKEMKINLTILCSKENSERKELFKRYCVNDSKIKMNRLHGEFLPAENRILLQSDAYLGSLIHEYIHYLQFNNKNLFDGKRYKYERAEIQKKLIQQMDEAIEISKKITKKEELHPYIQTVTKASESLMQFSLWQDLIDEKNIFLLYILFGNEFGARDEDIALAQKNMGFVCKREKLPNDQCPVLESKAKFTEEVYKLIKEIREKNDFSNVDKFLKNAPDRIEGKSLQEKVAIVNNYIFNDLKLESDNSYLSRKNMDNILPDSTLKFKKAHCLGLTILYLLVAEKMGIDAYMVRVPEHIFPRFCENNQCLNIETLKKGEIVTDQYYIDNLIITKNSIQNEFYLKNLKSPQELAASVYLGLGFVAGSLRQNELAELFYKKAIDNSKGLVDGYSNLAAIYFQQGRKNEAKIYLEIALKINPEFYPAMISLGAYYHNQNDLESALKYYNQAINIHPIAIDAYRRRSQVYKEQNKIKESLLDLERILIIEPHFCDILKESIDMSLDSKSNEKKKMALKEYRQKAQCVELPIH